MTASPVERAIAALRAGRPVGVGTATILSVETGTAATLELLDPDARAPILLSGERAAALRLGNAREAGDLRHAVQIGRSAWLDRDTANALADPSQDFDRGPIGPLTVEPVRCPCEPCHRPLYGQSGTGGGLDRLLHKGRGGSVPIVCVDAKPCSRAGCVQEIRDVVGDFAGGPDNP